MTHSVPEIADDRASTAHLTESERNQLLAGERRRVAISILDEESTPMGLETLAASIAAHETDTGEPGDRTVERVAIALHHRHLPKMDTLGVLEYDATTRQVN